MFFFFKVDHLKEKSCLTARKLLCLYILFKNFKNLPREWETRLVSVPPNTFDVNSQVMWLTNFLASRSLQNSNTNRRSNTVKVCMYICAHPDP